MPPAELKLQPPNARTPAFTTKFPKRSIGTAATLRSTLAKSLKGTPAPTVTAKPIPVKATKLTTARLDAIRQIHTSTAPTAEAVVGQKMGAQEIVGTLTSAFIALEYSKQESDYRRTLAAARTAADKADIDAKWATFVQGVTQAYAEVGLAGVKEADVQANAKTLQSSTANFNAILEIVNSATTSTAIASGAKLVASFVPQVGTLADIVPALIAIPDLCSKPFAEGSFTKHFGTTFSWTVKVPYPCGWDWKRWKVKWCSVTVTLASVAFSVDVSVGYKVSCCGATAWGSATAKACVTVLGVTLCAECSASITGVAGVGVSTSGSSCTYGVGVSAQLKCSFEGYTIFNVSAPFGFSIVGPCPPAGLCK